MHRRDAPIARLAERQHGVVARRQLVELGLGRGAIESRLAAGRLHLLHRGVYAVGHCALTRNGRWMAAVLAGGPEAVLSHWSAASLWGILRSSRTVVDVTCPCRHRHRTGVRIHRSRLPADETTDVEGIPVTGPPRTLFDLGAVVTPHKLERAVERAEALQLTDQLSLYEVLARHQRRPGAPALRQILAAGAAASTVTRSDLEDGFLSFLDAHGLPRPQVNIGIEVRGQWMECDCVWRSRRLIVELDGRATHDTAAAFERDRARDRALHAAGWQVIRLTWRQLHEDPHRLAADVAALLGKDHSTT
jgi:predicted transcriptional regulator of viral defense system